MKKLAKVIAVLFALTPGGAAGADPATPAPTETCFQVSANQARWARTPELLCLTSADGHSHTITLRTGMKGDQEIARFNLKLLSRVRSINENRDVFGLDNPTNSTFNALKIQFHGKRDVPNQTEVGTVSIGKTKLFYRLERRGTPVARTKTAP